MLCLCMLAIFCWGGVITHFYPRDFLGCRHAKRGSPNQVGLFRRGLITSNTPKKKVRDTFPKVRPSLARVDQV
jgi:hypothetical protein